MPGPSCVRVARCCEKSQRRRFEVSQGFLRRPGFPTVVASSGLLGQPFQLSQHTTTRKRSLMDFPIEVARANRRRRLSRMHCKRFSAAGLSMPVVPPLDRASIEELKDSYEEQSYYGGPTHECPYCGAVFCSRNE